MAGSEFLNPCEWFVNPPTAFLAATRLRADLPKIPMKKGKSVNVLVSDPEGKLQQNAKGQIDHSVSVDVIAPNGLHFATPSGLGPAGQNHLLAVPAGIPLKVDVRSATFSVSGNQRRPRWAMPLTSRRTGLPIGRGGVGHMGKCVGHQLVALAAPSYTQLNDQSSGS